jgi:hypothetical protein
VPYVSYVTTIRRGASGDHGDYSERVNLTLSRASRPAEPHDLQNVTASGPHAIQKKTAVIRFSSSVRPV